MPLLLLLLTMMTASAVPQSVPPRLMGARADDVAPGTTIECRVRMGSGGVPLVRVEVAPHVEAWFILDTGATGTTMHPDLAKRLHLPISGQTMITTVEGSVPAPTVRLPAITLGGLSLTHDLIVAVHDLRAVREVVPDADGILGHDVLARYDYLVDHTRQRLVIGRFGPPAHGVRLPLAWSAGRPAGADGEQQSGSVGTGARYRVGRARDGGVSGARHAGRRACRGTITGAAAEPHGHQIGRCRTPCRAAHRRHGLAAARAGAPAERRLVSGAGGRTVAGLAVQSHLRVRATRRSRRVAKVAAPVGDRVRERRRAGPDARVGPCQRSASTRLRVSASARQVALRSS